MTFFLAILIIGLYIEWTAYQTGFLPPTPGNSTKSDGESLVEVDLTKNDKMFID